MLTGSPAELSTRKLYLRRVLARVLSTWASLGSLTAWLPNSKCEPLKKGRQKWCHLLRQRLRNQCHFCVVTYPLRFIGREHRAHLFMGEVSISHYKKSMGVGIRCGDHLWKIPAVTLLRKYLLIEWLLYTLNFFLHIFALLLTNYMTWENLFYL